MNYVFDTSAVIFLLEICKIRKQLMEFKKTNSLYIPARVREEFLDGCKIDPQSIDVFSLVPPVLDKNLLAYFSQNASSGEYWTIAHACIDKTCVCVIDDGFGRNVCDFINMKHTGSVGIIDEMKKQGVLSKDDLLSIRVRVRQSKFYISKKLLRKLDEICTQ
jgi:predicted nucleic acid-binding protein